MTRTTTALICAAAIGVTLAAARTYVGSDDDTEANAALSNQKLERTRSGRMTGADQELRLLVQTVRSVEETVAAQERRIAELEERLAQVPEWSLTAAQSADAGTVQNSAPDATPEPASNDPRPRGVTTVTSLIAQGFAEADANALVADIDALQMERLQLVYEANQPGGTDTSALSAAMQALPSERELIEERFGAAGYDKFLYASERPNRLVVRDVLNNSPAAAIGLQAGDQLISAASQRIYSVGDLMRAATTATGGQMALVVQRGEALIESTIPAGPLGVTTGLERVEPKPSAR